MAFWDKWFNKKPVGKKRDFNDYNEIESALYSNPPASDSGAYKGKGDSDIQKSIQPMRTENMVITPSHRKKVNDIVGFFNFNFRAKTKARKLIDLEEREKASVNAEPNNNDRKNEARAITQLITEYLNRNPKVQEAYEIEKVRIDAMKTQAQRTQTSGEQAIPVIHESSRQLEASMPTLAATPPLESNVSIRGSQDQLLVHNSAGLQRTSPAPIVVSATNADENAYDFMPLSDDIITSYKQLMHRYEVLNKITIEKAGSKVEKAQNLHAMVLDDEKNGRHPEISSEEAFNKYQEALNNYSKIIDERNQTVQEITELVKRYPELRNYKVASVVEPANGPVVDIWKKTSSATRTVEPQATPVAVSASLQQSASGTPQTAFETFKRPVYQDLLATYNKKERAIIGQYEQLKEEHAKLDLSLSVAGDDEFAPLLLKLTANELHTKELVKRYDWLEGYELAMVHRMDREHNFLEELNIPKPTTIPTSTTPVVVSPAIPAAAADSRSTWERNIDDLVSQLDEPSSNSPTSVASPSLPISGSESFSSTPSIADAQRLHEEKRSMEETFRELEKSQVDVDDNKIIDELLSDLHRNQDIPPFGIGGTGAAKPDVQSLDDLLEELDTGSDKTAAHSSSLATPSASTPADPPLPSQSAELAENMRMLDDLLEGLKTGSDVTDAQRRSLSTSSSSTPTTQPLPSVSPSTTTPFFNRFDRALKQGSDQGTLTDISRKSASAKPNVVDDSKQDNKPNDEPGNSSPGSGMGGTK